MNKGYNFIRSDIKVLLLSLLSKKNMYGYQLIKELQEMSNNYFILKEGSLYPLLHSLEQDNLITSYWEETENQRKKKYYSLTENGKKVLNDEKKEWKTYFNYVNKIIGGDALEE